MQEQENVNYVKVHVLSVQDQEIIVKVVLLVDFFTIINVISNVLMEVISLSIAQYFNV